MGMMIDRAMDDVSITRWHIRLFLIMGLLYMWAAMNLLLIGLAVPGIVSEFSLDVFQQSVILSSVFVGMFIGASLSGFVADAAGRKTAIAMFFMLMEISMIFTALSLDWLTFTELRVITGVGIGGLIPLCFVYLSEFVPAHSRGKMLVMLDSFWAVGWIIAAVLGYLIIPAYGWRMYFIAGSMGLLLLPLLLPLPRSPRYLLIHGMEEKARHIINCIRKMAHLSPVEDKIESPESSKIPLKLLWSREYRKRTALAWIMWFCMVYGYYSIFLWIAKIMIVQYGYPLPTALYNAMVSSFSQIPGYFTAAWLVDKIGRKKVLSSFLAMSGMSVWIFILAAKDSIGAILSLSLMGFFILGAWGVVMTYTTELYPTAVRGRGYGAASGFGRIAGIVGTYMVGWLIVSIGIPGTLLVSGIVFVIESIAVIMLGIETKQKTLEEAARVD